ncbi:DUF3800 domain-containing protein [Nitrosomonas ureae]|nr:DUF3800 domain-containing protein [Nitrosomonas ureae]
MNYYIDESGNTGDLSLSGPDMDFGGQPVFSLAAIGISDTLALSAKLGTLRKKYNVHSQELKLSNIYKKKPDFLLEVTNYLTSNGAPFFIEVVDKKYLLAINITNYFVWPPYFNTKESEETVYLKNIFSDFIYHRIPNATFFAFLQTLKTPSNDSVSKFFDLFKKEIESQDHEIAEKLAWCVDESKDDFENIIEMEGADANKQFLPIPDEGKRGQVVWMLPNFSCFTNLYARINRYQGGELASCRIIHDEQAHFDEIIKESKKQVESFDSTKSGYSPPFADYKFHERADLFFTVSHDDPGIQVADLLSGMVMRHYWTQLKGESPPRAAKESFDALVLHSNRSRGIGINLVASHHMADILFGIGGY